MSEEQAPGRRVVSLGGGLRVPYAEPSTPAATKMGRANRRVGTKPEARLRSALHRQGLRFRKDHPIALPDGPRVRADVVFTRIRVLVFLDGCFWHRCPIHGTVPKSNRDYWLPKLEANAVRDRLVNQSFRAAGWTVIRAWEHEDPETVAVHVLAVVKRAGTA